MLRVGGVDRLFATTRYDGQLSSWSIGSGAHAQLDFFDHGGALAPGALGALGVIGSGSGTAILTGGGANGRLQLVSVSPSGNFGQAQDLAGTAGSIGALQATVTVSLMNGEQAVYGALGGRDGIGALTFSAGGSVRGITITADTETSYAAAVGDLAHLRVNGQDYLYSVSGIEHGLTVWTIAPDGQLAEGPSLGNEDGLWIAAPTALATAQVEGRDFLVLGAAQSGTLSVIAVEADGSLHVVDHVLDTRDTRFGGVVAVETAKAGGHTYVISGGADDGISVHQLLPGGRLLAVAFFEDRVGTSHRNVSDIALRSQNGDIEIFVSSATETGITKLLFDPGSNGITLKAQGVAASLTGTAGRDILQGGQGDDRLKGQAGDDVILDGAGQDWLSGGGGADVFVMSNDGSSDVIVGFTLGEDRIDLSGWPMVRSVSQLTITSFEKGMRIRYGEERLTVFSADGGPIDHRRLTDWDIVGGARIPEVILPGFAGPFTPPPDLPDTGRDGTGADSGFRFDGVRIEGLFFMNPKIGKTNGKVEKGEDRRDVLTGSKKGDQLMGNGGNDLLKSAAGSDKLFGGDGKDRGIGGAGDDWITGGHGADRLDGGGNEDWLVGGAGRDRLNGGAHDDYISGGNDGDALIGGAGRDRLYGGGDRDKLMGGVGGDRLLGGTGHDVLSGGAGGDVLYGGSGHDRLSGGAAGDRVVGRAGEDWLSGGSGGDALEGGTEADRLFGGAGQDALDGGAGHDSLNGGAGDDELRGGTGDDVLEGGGGDDVLAGDDGADSIDGAAGRDALDGGADNDLLFGGDGDDTLLGGEGADTLHGGEGVDLLRGGSGTDRLSGGDGSDWLFGGGGNDTIFGGTGNDTLAGSEGDDILWGDEGADTFIFSAGQDTVEDFVQGEDMLHIAFDAFPGRLVASELVLFYAEQVADTVIFDFENGNLLTVVGVTDFATLSASIEVI